MRLVRIVAGALLVGSVTLMAAAAPAGAASNAGRTYAGTFGGDIVYTDCGGTAPAPPRVAGGDWAVTVHGSSAKAVFDIEVNGEPHVAYTFPNMKLAYSTADVVFVAYGQTQAGLLTVTLYDSGALTYVIAPYQLDTVSCASVTYLGQLAD